MVMENNEPASTTMVFNRDDLVVNDHEWQQQGYMITDVCNPSTPMCHHVGIPIPSGKLLIKTEKGEYDLVDEKRS